MGIDFETIFFLTIVLGMLLFILLCSVFHLITSALDKDDEKVD